MNSPIDLSDDRSSDDVLIAKEQEIARVLEKLSEVKSWIDDNLRQPKDDDGESEKKFTLSIPCIIKHPKHLRSLFPSVSQTPSVPPELKGVIRKDLGDRFVVYIQGSDSTVTVSKLLVYPDFSSSVGQLEKNKRKKLHPSTNNPRKNRRRKNGQGNGSIYYRTVTKNGKEYTDAYYHYVENGKKRTKYIPKSLLDRVIDAESRSLPVTDILFLLGGGDKNPRKSSSTLSTLCDEKLPTNEVLETDKNNPRKINTPSTKRRKQGYGAGYIECKPIKRGNKEYKQYWYHYEIWESGDRQVKKSRYIPRRLLARVEELEAEKVAVKKILSVLGVERL